MSSEIKTGRDVKRCNHGLFSGIMTSDWRYWKKKYPRKSTIRIAILLGNKQKQARNSPNFVSISLHHCMQKVMNNVQLKNLFPSSNLKTFFNHPVLVSLFSSYPHQSCISLFSFLVYLLFPFGFYKHYPFYNVFILFSYNMSCPSQSIYFYSFNYINIIKQAI